MKLHPFLVATLAANAMLAGVAGAASSEIGGKWVGTWVSAQQPLDAHSLPPPPGLSRNTLRQLIQPSLGGNGIRVTFSNAYGEGPLTLAAANVARSKGDSTIDPTSICPLTFHGALSVTIPPGASMISDAAQFKVHAFEKLAISAYCASVPARITGHAGSRTTSFIQKGDRVSAAELPGAEMAQHWYLLAAVDVWANQSAKAILIIGDSITDGRGSITDQNNRWTDNLAQRLWANARTPDVAVLNQGIGGNCLLRNGLGAPALQRFDRDVLTPPGVRWVVIFEGINDIGITAGATARGDSATTVREILAGYEQMIIRAHAHGLRVYGATLMPFEGFGSYYNARSEEARQAVNRWIRTSGKFDGLIDFDAIARDQQNHLRLSPAVDGGDHLHPSAGGYKVMADGIDLTLFENDGGR